ncbi:MAG: fructosamine kinase family protein [Halioglobus sp.]
MDYKPVEQSISDATGRRFKVLSASSVSGGCINQCFVLDGEDERFFLKRNSSSHRDMLTAEARALETLIDCRSLRAPTPIASGEDDMHSWLVLEYLDLVSPAPNTSALLGEGLARLHQNSADRFGWDQNNFIGTTIQVNNWTADWVSFYTRQRLGFQLELAKSNGAEANLVDAGQRLMEQTHKLFSSYKPVPSLLHGDLWAGNWGASPNGKPVIFDPAAYYGDREADLAMTELFGGFDDRFYQSYRGTWDIDPGYTTRKVLYNLYHILNHFNLFGGGYAAQARDMMEQLNVEAS